MNTPKAILIGLSLIAAAIASTELNNPAQAQSGTGNYLIASGIEARENANVYELWRVHSESGKVSHCYINWNSNKPHPYCSGWSD